MIFRLLIIFNLLLFYANPATPQVDTGISPILERLKQNLCCNMDSTELSMDKSALVLRSHKDVDCSRRDRGTVVFTENRLDLSQMKRWWFLGFNISIRTYPDERSLLFFQSGPEFISDQDYVSNLRSIYGQKRIGQDGLEIVGLGYPEHFGLLNRLKRDGVTSYVVHQYCDQSFTIGRHISKLNAFVSVQAGQEDLAIDLLEQLYLHVK